MQQALALLPELLFLDIRMPGIDGLEAAQQIVEDWPCERPLPLIVFVTAYDQHALAAFERAAVDYLLKPVQTQRLAQTCERLRGLLAARGAPADAAQPAAALDPVLQQLQRLLGQGTGAAAAPQTQLKVIQAGVGNTLHMVPLAEVLVFEAADKYVRVLTEGREHLIRQSLRELLPQLDESEFWQVHRGTVVRATAIETRGARRDLGPHPPVTARPAREDRGQPALRAPLQGDVSSVAVAMAVAAVLIVAAGATIAVVPTGGRGDPSDRRGDPRGRGRGRGRSPTPARAHRPRAARAGTPPAAHRPPAAPTDRSPAAGRR